jgi:hypothetical protein
VVRGSRSLSKSLSRSSGSRGSSSQRAS